MPGELFYHKHRSSCGVDGSLSFTVNLKFMSWTCCNLHASCRTRTYFHVEFNFPQVTLHYTVLNCVGLRYYIELDCSRVGQHRIALHCTGYCTVLNCVEFHGNTLNWITLD